MTEVSLKLFFSYSHKDESLRDELADHLATLKREGVISRWHDRKILPGQERDHQINDNLNTADIILLLVSSNFLASDYCWDVEVKRAIERHNAGEACVIPVILRPVDWKGTPFAKLQALPKNAEPIVSRNWHTTDEAFMDVAKGIRAAVEKLKQEREERQQKLQRQREQEAERLRQQETARLQKQHEQEKVERLQREQEAERLRQQREAEQQEAYANNLRLYEQEFSKAVYLSNPISEYVRNGLKQFQQSLNLRDEDVRRVEKTILAPLEEVERIRKQQEAEKLQRGQEEAERIRKQQEAERLKRQQEEAERRLQETDDLSSDKGVDYRRLRDLLKAGDWKKADRETLQVMLKVAGREKEGWLDIDSITKFPCTDLRTIDQLWAKYSNGRFGFSVQKRIWDSVGGHLQTDYETWCKFGDHVGWYKKEFMIFGDSILKSYDDLTFNVKAPEGHLPARCGMEGVWQFGWRFWVSLLSRRDL
ncbi:GUN4 domain-containing protein [Nostoc sp. CENA543]|uniref:GUN4 domain-containing protein n=1 Tax=Nostoc sp. CENA543 TaxID=1869241 RepID=UPI00186535BF|nr:GUN4 domain-containing protein [Nostoc sp. CENA543]